MSHTWLKHASALDAGTLQHVVCLQVYISEACPHDHHHVMRRPCLCLLMLECGDTWCSTSTTPAIADLSPNTVMWRTVWCMLNNQNMQSTRGKGRTLQCVVQPGSQSRWNKQSALMCRQHYRACHILAGSCPNIHARVHACQCATVARSMHAFPACDKINGHCTPTPCRTMLKKLPATRQRRARPSTGAMHA